jgi:hypothetical protein
MHGNKTLTKLMKRLNHMLVLFFFLGLDDDDLASPISLFLHLFTDDLTETLVRNTNAYAACKLCSKFFYLSVDFHACNDTNSILLGVVGIEIRM